MRCRYCREPIRFCEDNRWIHIGSSEWYGCDTHLRHQKGIINTALNKIATAQPESELVNEILSRYNILPEVQGM
jgi:Zn-finger protein